MHSLKYIVLLIVLLFCTSIKSESQEDFEHKDTSTTFKEEVHTKLSINDYLLTSIDSGYYQYVSYYLIKGADPNSISLQNEYSALMLASFLDHFDIAELLIKKGADVNYRTPEGNSALIIATQKGYYDIADLLIKKGAEINPRTVDSTSALFEAVKFLNDSITTLLIKNGSLVNIIDYSKFTPLQYSVGYNLLYSKLNGDDGVNKLLDSFIFHSKANKISELLITAGANVDVTDIFGNTPLMVATQLNNLALVNILCKAGANPNIANDDSITPLMFATSEKLFDISSVLFKNGAKVNDQLENNEMLLYEILSVNDLLLNKSAEGDYKSVIFLLEHGANPNYSNEEGITALMYVSDNGYYNIAKLLIEHGADVNYKPLDGNTALLAAIRANNDSIAELLIQNKAKLNVQNNDSLSPLHYAAGYGYPMIVDLLLYYGATVDISDLNGNTPLMNSVYAGAYKVTELLINAGADVNKSDILGNTPIMVAAQFNDTTLIRMLFYAGADINKVNSSKCNALLFANKNNSVDAFKMLIGMGAITDDSNLKKSYFQQAIEDGNYEISSFLERKGLKTKLKPNIGGINFYTGFSASNYDFMLDFGGGIYEPTTKLMINLGYKYRPFTSRVLEYRNSTFYQLWEKRYAFYLSLQYLFVLKRSSNNTKIGFVPGISNELTWSYYRGLDQGSGTKWTFVPSIGLFYQINMFTIISKWEIAKYNKQVKSFDRFGLQLLLTLPNSRNTTKNKKIQWLD